MTIERGTARERSGNMITSGAFSYINVLDKAADASWLREATITNNLANVDTPGFKRKDVDFEGVLKTGTWKKQVCNTGSESKGSAYEPFECNSLYGFIEFFLPS